MKVGLRGRVFIVSVILILAVGTTSAYYLEYELRTWLEGRTERELIDHARSALVAIELSPDAKTKADFDGLATQLARYKEERVTILANDGSVLGDSVLSLDAVRSSKNLGDRTEIIDAQRQGMGVARTYSEVERTNILYVAIPFQHKHANGVLRIGMPLRVVDQAVRRMQIIFLIAGLLGLALTLMVSFFASHLFSRRLRSLLVRARSVVEGHGGRPGQDESSDEITLLRLSLDRLDAALEEIVNTLASERNRFAAVLEGMKEAVIAVDGDRRISLTNHAAIEYLDVDAEGEPIGRRLKKVIDSPDIRRAVKNALKGKATELDITIQRGEPRHILGRVTPQVEGAGCVIVMNDVTRLRRLETMRRDFVANVSHELRTPTSVLRINAEALRDGALTDPVAGPKFVDALLRNAERLSDLIADLLHISRIESGQYILEADSLMVGSVLNDVSDTVAPLAVEKNISLTIDVPDGLQARIDRLALEHVLINLVQNGVKYTPSGGEVSMRVEERDATLRFEIADNGPGIAEKHRSRIFERFYRVDKGRSKHMGGTGLGLAIVKHLVANMDGQVGVLPNEPKGSLFWVELPTLAEDLPDN